MKIIYVKQISPPVFSAGCWLLDTIPQGPIADKFHEIMVEQDNKHVTGRQPVEYNNNWCLNSEDGCVVLVNIPMKTKELKGPFCF